MTIENGCLYYAKGIGNDKKLYHNQETKSIPDDLVDSWEWYPVTCRRNDIIVFNAFIPHKSSINNTNSFRRIYYFTYNKASEGRFREDYFNKKREVFPQDVDKISGKDYSKIGIKYNLGNPISTNIINK
jgi:2-aminoethylphosphonate dioxygenase